jgi:hypothetical protein
MLKFFPWAQFVSLYTSLRMMWAENTRSWRYSSLFQQEDWPSTVAGIFRNCTSDGLRWRTFNRHSGQPRQINNIDCNCVNVHKFGHLKLSGNHWLRHPEPRRHWHRGRSRWNNKPSIRCHRNCHIQQCDKRQIRFHSSRCGEIEYSGPRLQRCKPRQACGGRQTQHSRGIQGRSRYHSSRQGCCRSRQQRGISYGCSSALASCAGLWTFGLYCSYLHTLHRPAEVHKEHRGATRS